MTRQEEIGSLIFVLFAFAVGFLYGWTA